MRSCHTDACPMTSSNKTTSRRPPSRSSHLLHGKRRRLPHHVPGTSSEASRKVRIVFEAREPSLASPHNLLPLFILTIPSRSQLLWSSPVDLESTKVQQVNNVWRNSDWQCVMQGDFE